MSWVCNLSAREWIMIISVVIIVTGWFVNSHINRRHEIFKKKLDYRLTMLESYIPVAFTLEKLLNPNRADERDELAKVFIEKLEISQVKILLYGSKSEIDLINEITDLAQQNKHAEMKNKSAQLMQIIRSSLRSELGIKDI